ncbi:MAG: 3-dehydroquinate synthase II [Candidatus Bathyarchaeota archaeon]
MRELWVTIEKSMPLKLKKAFVKAATGSCSVIISDKTDIPLVKANGLRAASFEEGDITIISESKIDLIGTLPKPLCLRLEIRNRRDEDKVVKAAEKGVDYVAISCPDWKIIPLENLVAKTRGATKLLAEVSNSEEAKVALETLELGVDGIILKTSELGEIKLTLNAIADLDRRGSEEHKIQLVSAKVIRCAKLSAGARACIDTCDIMFPGDGILAGCSSSGLFLVQAEVEANPHVEPRPFRVNAGPVSLYTLVPEGNTRYLSELRAGDEALIVDREGRSRKTIIGRVKIERRPLMLVEAEVDDDEVKTIVQNAETIRFVTKDGSKSVVDLKQGDEILVYHQIGGRHFGILVEEETAIER